MRTMNKSNGFTLIELVITVTIVIILAALAIPNYRNHVLRSNRTDAMAALLHVAAAQEKFYLQNNTYADDIADLNLDTLSPNDNYDMEVTAGDAAGFVATATPSESGSQTHDAACTEFSINQLGVKSATGSGDNPTEVCWR